MLMRGLQSLKAVSKLVYLLLAMAVFIGALCSPAEAECVETVHGNGWSYVDCGRCGAVWRGNTMVDFGCDGQKPIDPYQNPLIE
jgi:hypothetical protein